MAYLDLCDLAKELADLRGMRDDANDGLCEADAERLAALEGLEGQFFTDSLEGYAKHEAIMIPEDTFEDYAQEFAYDVGWAGRDGSNPLMSFIDWEGWAEELKQEYTEVTFDGRTYLIRTY